MAGEYDNFYLKVLGPNRTAYYGGSGQWAEPGVWMPKLTPRLCRSGYHVLVDTRQLLDWLGPEIWLCEVRGKIVHDTNKSVAAEARLVERLPWDDRTARLFAADCAEDVLPIFERERPNDSRPRDAIEAARLFADSHISRPELAAAWAAARDAAWDAARAAEGAAAWTAAWTAARDAAWTAAWTAARDAALAAARDAARDAAWDTARDTARAAEGAAAWTAARAAARDAAWTAARATQAVRLAEVLGVEPPGWDR